MSESIATNDSRLSRNPESVSEMLLGMYRDAQAQSLKLGQHAQELQFLRTELEKQRAGSDLRMGDALELRQQTELVRRSLVEQGEILQRLRDDQKQRCELLERRIVQLEEDLRFERARLSELRADVEGAQDKWMRAQLAASQARGLSTRAVWFSAFAVTLSLFVAGLGWWPSIRSWLH
jgi:hypothetical protein